MPQHSPLQIQPFKGFVCVRARERDGLPLGDDAVCPDSVVEPTVVVALAGVVLGAAW